MCGSISQEEQQERTWWRVPRRPSEDDEHRHVSFLELFYDLIYVIIIAEIAHTLAEDITWTHLVNFAFLLHLS